MLKTDKISLVPTFQLLYLDFKCMETNFHSHKLQKKLQHSEHTVPAKEMFIGK